MISRKSVFILCTAAVVFLALHQFARSISTETPKAASLDVERQESLARRSTDKEKHVEELFSRGYTVVPCLTDAETAAVKSALTALEAQGIGTTTKVQHRIFDIANRHPTFARLLINPCVNDIVEQYLGKHFRIGTFSSNTLFPQDGKLGIGLGWHVDYPWHDIEDPWPKEVLGAQVTWLLDDFRADNGATQFHPGSHRLLRKPLQNESAEGAELLLAKRGCVLITHSAWWHRQTHNKSNATRSALLMNFVRGFVVPKENLEEQFVQLMSGPFNSSFTLPERAKLRKLMLGPFQRGVQLSLQRDTSYGLG